MAAALGRVDQTLTAGTTDLRGAVRAAGVDTGQTFQTIVGPIAFDERGDVRRPLTAIYMYESAADDWVYVEQIAPEIGSGN